MTAVHGDQVALVAAASAAAFALAMLSAVAGFGGGVLLLPVFTALFGLRVAVPVLTLTQLSSNGARVWLNRRELRWPIVGGSPPVRCRSRSPAACCWPGRRSAPLQRLLGVFLIAVVVWRRRNPAPARPGPRFAAVGAGSGLGSALLGSVGPLTAPFFLAYGLARAAYIGTEAAAALTMHLAKLAAYGASDLLTARVLALGAALTPATLAGAWAGRKVVGRISDRVFVRLVEAGLLVAGVLFLLGL